MVQNFVPASDYRALRIKDRTAGHSDGPLAFINQSFFPRQQKPTPEEGRPKTKKGAGWPRWEKPMGAIGKSCTAKATQPLSVQAELTTKPQPKDTMVRVRPI